MPSGHNGPSGSDATEGTLPSAADEVTVAFAQLVGRSIATARKSANISQIDLSAALGIAQSTLSRIEKGYAPADVAQLYLIGSFLGIPPETLVASASRAAAQLEHRNAKITGGCPPRPDKPANPQAAKTAYVVGHALLGAVGPLMMSMLADKREPEE